jgi:hypothetical protein
VKPGTLKAYAPVIVALYLWGSFSAYASDAKVDFPQLQVEDFPKLPAPVAAVLRDRHCTIPQPARNGPARNVIAGEFFNGQKGWAVLCARDGHSSILVFRNASDNTPDEIAPAADSGFIADGPEGKPLYLRQISAVGRKFILDHYSAYGGPKPPPIDHNGIDDAFLEKASVTWYWHKGKWMQLSGAD